MKVRPREELPAIEALRAIDELTALGIHVRFASHPALDPDGPDDRLYLNICFGMVWRETGEIAALARACAYQRADVQSMAHVWRWLVAQPESVATDQT